MPFVYYEPLVYNKLTEDHPSLMIIVITKKQYVS